jgi:hypothetical protein
MAEYSLPVFQEMFADCYRPLRSKVLTAPIQHPIARCRKWITTVLGLSAANRTTALLGIQVHPATTRRQFRRYGYRGQRYLRALVTSKKHQAITIELDIVPCKGALERVGESRSRYQLREKPTFLMKRWMRSSHSLFFSVHG